MDTNWRMVLDSARRFRNRGRYLARCAEVIGLEVKTAAEIGVFKGGLSVELRQFFPEARIILVDPWRHIPAMTRQLGDSHRIGGSPEANQRHWDGLFSDVQKLFEGDNNVQFIRRFSSTAVRVVPDESLDLIYLDADHRYQPVVDDIKRWLPKLRHGGIFSGHDYKANRGRRRRSRRMYQVFEAVNDTIGEENVVSGRSMTWVWRKP